MATTQSETFTYVPPAGQSGAGVTISAVSADPSVATVSPSSAVTTGTGPYTVGPFVVTRVAAGNTVVTFSGGSATCHVPVESQAGAATSVTDLADTMVAAINAAVATTSEALPSGVTASVGGASPTVDAVWLAGSGHATDGSEVTAWTPYYLRSGVTGATAAKVASATAGYTFDATTKRLRFGSGSMYVPLCDALRFESGRWLLVIGRRLAGGAHYHNSAGNNTGGGSQAIGTSRPTVFEGGVWGAHNDNPAEPFNQAVARPYATTLAAPEATIIEGWQFATVDSGEVFVQLLVDRDGATLAYTPAAPGIGSDGFLYLNGFPGDATGDDGDVLAIVSGHGILTRAARAAIETFAVANGMTARTGKQFITSGSSIGELLGVSTLRATLEAAGIDYTSVSRGGSLNDTTTTGEFPNLGWFDRLPLVEMRLRNPARSKQIVFCYEWVNSKFYNSGLTAAANYAEVKIVAQALKDAGFRVMTATPIPWNNGSNGDQRTYAAGIATAVLADAAFWDAGVVDWHAAATAGGDPTTDTAKLYDGVHPTAAFYNATLVPPLVTAINAA